MGSFLKFMILKGSKIKEEDVKVSELHISVRDLVEFIFREGA